jgi:hypothetical protein
MSCPDLQRIVAGCDSGGTRSPMLSPVLAVTITAIAATVPSITSPLTVQLIRRCPPDAACAPIEVVQEMKRETERIWFALGVQLNWVELSSTDPKDHPVSDLVVMFEEHPRPVVGGSVLQRLVLGSMHQPATPCDAGVAHLWVAHVRRHVETVYVHGVPLISGPTHFARLAFAHALGRALAHEVGHYLLGPVHAPYGLMRAQFSAHELLDTPTLGAYALDSKSRSRLIARRLERADRQCGTPGAPMRGASQP